MRTYRTVSLNALWFLIALNIIIFIAIRAAGPYPIITVQDALDNPISKWLALYSPDFLRQPWTILTSMFVHAEFWHIFGNMISLFFLGRFLLQLVGENRFLAVYFLGGLVGSLLFVALAPYSLGIGASGAIFALGGALVMMAPKLRVFIIPIPIPIPLWIAIIIFLLISFVPGIAWQAHLGGLLLGLGAGYYFKKRGYFYF